MDNESTPNQNSPPASPGENGVFKWSCLCATVIVSGVFAWMVNDVRLELKRTTTIVNENLPIILEQTRSGTETLATLSEDMRELRDLAGATGPRDHTLVTYADGILDLVAEQSEARVGIEKLIGTSLDDPVSAADWVADARKEAVWQSLRSGTRFELLDRLCHNKYGSPWQIQFGDDDPQLLLDWLCENHPETGEIVSDHVDSETGE